MSNLGLKISGTELEVGFNAGTREEFDSYLAKLTMIADTVWPPSAAAQGRSGGLAAGVGYHEQVAAVNQVVVRGAIPPSTVEAFERQQRETVAKVKAAVGSQDIVSAARGWREEQGLR